MTEEDEGRMTWEEIMGRPEGWESSGRAVGGQDTAGKVAKGER